MNRNTKITQISYGMNNFHPYDLYSFNFWGGGRSVRIIQFSTVDQNSHQYTAVLR